MVQWLQEWLQGWLEYLRENGLGILLNILIVVLTILITGPVARRVDHLIRRLFAKVHVDGGVHDRRVATAGTLVGSIVRYALWGTGFAICLSVLGLSSQAGGLIAAAGISGGVIIGLGAQSLLQDFFYGFVFLFDHPFAVGDLVSIGGLTGTVDSLKLRTTVIRSFSGDRHMIPNGSVGAVTNYSADNSLAVCEIYVPAAYGLERLTPILEEASLAAVAGDENVVEPPCVLGITAFTDRGMMAIRTICHTKPLQHWPVERKLRASQLEGLLRAGIRVTAGDQGM